MARPPATRHPRSVRWGLAGLLFCAPTLPVPHDAAAWAQQAPAESLIEFDIPAQPLDAALTRFFGVTGVQLLYDGKLTTGRRSAAVRGRMTARAGLRRLLSGTGLIARYTKANAAIIAMPDDAGSTPLIPLGRVVVRERIGTERLAPVERMAYYQQLRAGLEAFLRSDPRTRDRTFDLLLDLRIADDGRMIEVLPRRTGERLRSDRMIAEALRDARVAPPPPLLDQPLRIAVRGRRR